METIMFTFCLAAPTLLLLFSNYMNDREIAKLKDDINKELQLMQNRIDVLNGTCVKTYDKYDDKYPIKRNKHNY